MNVAYNNVGALRRTTGRRDDPDGFSLIEALLVIGVLAIIATAVAPAVLQRILEARVDATRNEARALHEALVGRPDQPGSHGFVGHMGRLPKNFEELVRPGRLPLYTNRTVRSVGMGWNGPYINIGDSPTDYLEDAFGRPYTGAPTGQVMSLGPDGTLGTADDIKYPPNPPIVTGAVAVSVKTSTGQRVRTDPAGYFVRLYFASEGTQAFLLDDLPPFVFEGVPMGLHAVELIRQSDGALIASDTIASLGGGQTKLVELWHQMAPPVDLDDEPPGKAKKKDGGDDGEHVDGDEDEHAGDGEDWDAADDDDGGRANGGSLGGNPGNSSNNKNKNKNSGGKNKTGGRG